MDSSDKTSARDLLPAELRGDFDHLCLEVQRAMLNMERFQAEQSADRRAAALARGRPPQAARTEQAGWSPAPGKA